MRINSDQLFTNWAGKECDGFVCQVPGVSKLSPELSELVVYTRSVPFKGFEQAAKSPSTDMSSFSESEALRHVKDSGMMCVCD